MMIYLVALILKTGKQSSDEGAFPVKSSNCFGTSLLY